MKWVEVDATLELELPEGADVVAHAKRLIDAIEAIALVEEYCVAWQVSWEPGEDASAP